MLKHRSFWILNLHHFVFFSRKRKRHDFYANILNVRNKRYFRNLILSFQSDANFNFNSTMIPTVLRLPIFNYRIQLTNYRRQLTSTQCKLQVNISIPYLQFSLKIPGWIINNGNTLDSRNYNLYNICAHCQLRGKSIPNEHRTFNLLRPGRE